MNIGWQWLGFHSLKNTKSNQSLLFLLLLHWLLMGFVCFFQSDICALFSYDFEKVVLSFSINPFCDMIQILSSSQFCPSASFIINTFFKQKFQFYVISNMTFFSFIFSLPEDYRNITLYHTHWKKFQTL